MPHVGGDHILIEANGTHNAERGEGGHATAQEREKCDTRSPVAAPDPTVRRMHTTRSHIREYGATEGCPGCKGTEAGRSMPHDNEWRMTRARMEQNEDGREGLKKGEPRQDRHLEKAVTRSVEEDPELRRAEGGA